jgi:hypothetical protein
VRVKVGVPMAHTYDAENKIDVFSRPSFKFERQGERLHVHFLDWHRRWSHSLTLAAALGLAATGIAALTEFLTRGSPTRTSRVTLPVAVLGGLYQWQRRRGKPEARESLQQRDIVSETEEVEVG